MPNRCTLHRSLSVAGASRWKQPPTHEATSAFAARRGCCVRGVQRVVVTVLVGVIALPAGEWMVLPGWLTGALSGPAAAIWCLWSLSRLWVAVISLYSERAADLPRRWKRSMRRLNFVFANTGSIIAFRFA
jgi:hypothetical protein